MPSFITLPRNSHHYCFWKPKLGLAFCMILNLRLTWSRVLPKCLQIAEKSVPYSRIKASKCLTSVLFQVAILCCLLDFYRVMDSFGWPWSWPTREQMVCFEGQEWSELFWSELSRTTRITLPASSRFVEWVVHCCLHAFDIFQLELVHCFFTRIVVAYGDKRIY